MSLSYSQRMTDPRWRQAGALFGAAFEVTSELATANPHAYVNIRFAVREAAIGAPDSCYDDPDAVLENTVRKSVKPEARATAVLAECQRIVRSAPREVKQMSSRLIDEFGKDRGEILECAWQDTALDGVRAYQVYVKYPSPPPAPQSQVEAVMDVLAPYVQPTEYQRPELWPPVRVPIFRLDYEGQPVMPSDDQVRAMAEQIVTAVRTSSGEV